MLPSQMEQFQQNPGVNGRTSLANTRRALKPPPPPPPRDYKGQNSPGGIGLSSGQSKFSNNDFCLVHATE